MNSIINLLIIAIANCQCYPWDNNKISINILFHVCTDKTNGQTVILVMFCNGARVEVRIILMLLMVYWSSVTPLSFTQVISVYH